MTPPKLSQTPAQTVGPFFGYALPYPGGAELVPKHHPRAIRFHGTVLDGAGDPVPDALLEIWQADENGAVSTGRGSLDRDGHTFTGFGRAATSLAGHYEFSTVKPGAADGGAPRLLVAVFARGLTNHLLTRAYFPEDAADHATDPVLVAVPATRRHTLVATDEGSRSYRFDIRLQGAAETVFLDFDG